MPREYVVTFEMVSVSLVQDLIAIYGAAGKMARIRSVSLKCTESTEPTPTQLVTRCRILPATVTSGSVGTAPTPRPVDPGDAAATITARVNDTTKATTSGTAEIVAEGAEHVMAGYDKSWPADARPIIGPTAAFVFELIQAPSSALHMSGELTVEEFG
jgi:hypothetical protein